jgi:hypothetical protein
LEFHCGDSVTVYTKIERQQCLSILLSLSLSLSLSRHPSLLRHPSLSRHSSLSTISSLSNLASDLGMIVVGGNRSWSEWTMVLQASYVAALTRVILRDSTWQ